MIFVLLLLMWRPILADVDSRHVVLSCICAWLTGKSARLSAKSRSSSCDDNVLCVICGSLALCYLIVDVLHVCPELGSDDSGADCLLADECLLLFPYQHYGNSFSLCVCVCVWGDCEGVGVGEEGRGGILSCGLSTELS